jgi:hypothetical protein
MFTWCRELLFWRQMLSCSLMSFGMPGRYIPTACFHELTMLSIAFWPSVCETVSQQRACESRLSLQQCVFAEWRHSP